MSSLKIIFILTILFFSKNSYAYSENYSFLCKSFDEKNFSEDKQPLSLFIKFKSDNRDDYLRLVNPEIVYIYFFNLTPHYILDKNKIVIGKHHVEFKDSNNNLYIFDMVTFSLLSNGSKYQCTHEEEYNLNQNFVIND